MKTEETTTDLGEHAVIHRNDKGNWLCAVCGAEWKETENCEAIFLLNCQDVCYCCKTQWGLDDIDELPPRPSNPAELRWHRLRIKWLNRIGWPESALEQLRTNLSIDTGALEREAGRAE